MKLFNHISKKALKKALALFISIGLLIGLFSVTAAASESKSDQPADAAFLNAYTVSTSETGEPAEGEVVLVSTAISYEFRYKGADSGIVNLDDDYINEADIIGVVKALRAGNGNKIAFTVSRGVIDITGIEIVDTGSYGINLSMYGALLKDVDFNIHFNSQGDLNLPRTVVEFTLNGEKYLADDKAGTTVYDPGETYTHANGLKITIGNDSKVTLDDGDLENDDDAAFYTAAEKGDTWKADYEVEVEIDEDTGLASRPSIPNFLIDLQTSEAANVGDSVVFEVEATGDGDITYQWYKNSTPVETSDPTGKTYTIDSAQLTDNDTEYMVTAINTKNELRVRAASTVCKLTVTKILVPFTSIKLDPLSVKLSAPAGGSPAPTATITATTAPAVTDDRVVFESTKPDVATVNADTGVVTAVAQGETVIVAKSNLKPSVSAIAYVSVEAPPTDGKLQKIKYADNSEIDKRIVKDLNDDPIDLIFETAANLATWKSSDTKVAAVAPNGKVTFKGQGTTTITATAKTAVAGVKATEDLIITVRDLTPKLPVSTVKIYSKSSTGTAVKILPSDYFDLASYDDVVVVGSDADRFNLTKDSSDPTTYYLSTKENKFTAKSTTVKMKLQAVNTKAAPAERNVGGEFNLTAVVSTILPAPKATISTLDIFTEDSSGQIIVTGTDLPEIVSYELVGQIKDNFDVSPKGIISAKDIVSFTDAKKTKPTVKGTLRIFYKDFGTNAGDYSDVTITVPLRPAPKLSLKPATQTINTNLGYTTSFEVVGGKVDRVAKADGVAANEQISGNPSNTGNVIEVTMKTTLPANNKLQLSVWLDGAKMPILVSPTVKKSTAATSYKLSAKSVTVSNKLDDQVQLVQVIPSQSNAPVIFTVEPQSGSDKDKVAVEPEGESVKVTVDKDAAVGPSKYNVIVKTGETTTTTLVLTVTVNNKAVTAAAKAEKGNIDFMNQDNTMLSYVPTIKGTANKIIGVTPIINKWTKTGTNPNENDKDMFEVVWNARTQRVEVRTLSAEALDELGLDYYKKGFAYKMQFEFELEGTGNKVSTADITIKPLQTKPKHNIRKNITMYQSRTGFAYKEVIDLRPTSPAGAKIDLIKFKDDTEKNIKAGKFVNNPNDAFRCYFDEDNQQLHVWIVDSAKAKAAKNTLVFEVSYAGQATERVSGSQTVKLIDLKLPVNVLK